ncbi:MAG TPA: MBL fold metallo-hydrolase [Longimicrobiales bacterium]
MAEQGAGMPAPRAIRASNASPLTLDGTRTYLVGSRRVAIIDPGPDLPGHLNAVAEAVGNARVVAILVTHDHPDHMPGAARLARNTGAPVFAAVLGNLREGDVFGTDAGGLVALATPGHAPDHVAFFWPNARAVFCGDLMLGGMDTALVAPPEGDLSRYLASLHRLRDLDPAVIYPTHGEPFTDPQGALDAYLRHRQARQDAVLAALAFGPATPEAIAGAVYGVITDAGLRTAALGSTRGYLQHLERLGRVRPAGETWELTT